MEERSQDRASTNTRFFFLVFFLLFLLLLFFFYHSYHKNNCLSRKDESFFNNRGQNIVTAYDRDINKTNKTRHKDSTNEPSLNETRNVNLYSSNVLDLRLFSPIDVNKETFLIDEFKDRGTLRSIYYFLPHQ